MKLSDKFKYMIIGAVIALTGFGVGSLVTGIDAQNQVGIFDTVYVKKLRVSDEIKVGGFDAMPEVVIGRTDLGGAVIVYEKDGISTAGMQIMETGGHVSVSAKDGQGWVTLHIAEGNGSIQLVDKNDDKGLMLTVVDGEGSIFKIDKSGTMGQIR